MPFDKDKFITQARAGGIEENQAEFLAEQMDAKTVQPEDLQALENRLRSQLTDTADALRDEAEARAVLARVQMDDLTKDFSKNGGPCLGQFAQQFCCAAARPLCQLGFQHADHTVGRDFFAAVAGLGLGQVQFAHFCSDFIRSSP